MVRLTARCRGRGEQVTGGACVVRETGEEQRCNSDSLKEAYTRGKENTKAQTP